MNYDELCTMMQHIQRKGKISIIQIKDMLQNENNPTIKVLHGICDALEMDFDNTKYCIISLLRFITQL